MGLLNEDASLLLAAPVSQSEPSGQGAGPSAPAVLGERFSQISVTLTAFRRLFLIAGHCGPSRGSGAGLPRRPGGKEQDRQASELRAVGAPPGGRTVGKWEAGG